MDVLPAAARPTRRGPADWFTGTVWLDEVAVCGPPSRLTSNRVTFEPGARTHWHTHPVGQVIHILSGVGRAQSDSGPVRELLPGDTVVFAPGERHWHGAAPDRLFVHLAVQEKEGGSSVTWLEPVTDAEYRGT